MTLNHRATIEHALQVAELVDRYIPRAIQKDDDAGLTLMASMVDVLENVRGYLAAPDSMSQEEMRKIAASAHLLLQEYERRTGRRTRKTAVDIPAEEIGEGDDQEESDDEDAPAVESLSKFVRGRLQGKLSERAWWQSLGYK
jgi:hypothetical protein